jgi:hypothetical protein
MEANVQVTSGGGGVRLQEDSSIHSATYPPDEMILAAMLTSVHLP